MTHYIWSLWILSILALHVYKCQARVLFKGPGLGDNGNYILSQEPMEYNKAEAYCKQEKATLANLSGEKAANAAFLALHQYVGPSTLWCGWASMKSLVTQHKPVFRVWDPDFYGPDIDHSENYNYVICEKGGPEL